MKLNQKYPIFANTPPWNALILLGVRTFKTIAFPWKYRGKVYLYDSQRKNWTNDHYAFVLGLDRGVSERRIKKLVAPGKIVGTVDIVGTRSGKNCQEANHEVLLANAVKFKKPVTFRWPKGAIRIARVKETA